MLPEINRIELKVKCDRVTVVNLVHFSRYPVVDAHFLGCDRRFVDLLNLRSRLFLTPELRALFHVHYGVPRVVVHKTAGSRLPVCAQPSRRRDRQHASTSCFATVSHHACRPTRYSQPSFFANMNINCSCTIHSKSRKTAETDLSRRQKITKENILYFFQNKLVSQQLVLPCYNQTIARNIT